MREVRSKPVCRLFLLLLLIGIVVEGKKLPQSNEEFASNYTNISSPRDDDSSLFRSLEGLESKIENVENDHTNSSSEEDGLILDGFSWKCMGCRGSVGILRFLFERNATTERILQMANYICQTFADQDALICKGITAQFKEPFLYVLEQMTLRPQQLCGLLVRDCGVPGNPFDGNWTIPLPPKPFHHKEDSRRRTDWSRHPNNEQRPIFKVIQLSDLHFDFEYQNGTEARCGRPVCCQGEPDPDANLPAGYWGTLAACDVPLRTIESLFSHISREHLREAEKKVDYIMLTGDYMSHSDWTYTKENHQFVISNLSSLINTYFPDTPVFWAIGNHEGVPVNTFAPHTVPKKFWPDWLYKSVYNAGHKWIPPEQYATTIYRGSFSCMITEKLKLISLNTGYCEVTNFFIYLNQTDPDGTLEWLVKELYDAEQKGAAVHIMSHIPPGDRDCLEGWARNYYRIVTRFEYTIRGQFFGHIHTDSFTVFFENMNDFRSRPISVLYAAPSVTTYENLNPSYRVYYIDGNYDQSTYEILDFDTYFLNLSRSQDDLVDPKWEFLYSARQEYDLVDLTPKSWNELGEKLRYNTTLYNKFVKNYARRHDYVCNDKCRAELLCSLRRGHHNETALCPENSLLRRIFPTLSSSYIIDPAILEPLTRDDFILEAKRTIWNKISKWLFGESDSSR